jgi:hypothetical protein
VHERDGHSVDAGDEPGDANLPLALSSAAISRRSILATNPRASNSSRSRRFFSSAPSGRRASAQRKVGGMAVVVITAMATITV